jgi:radical SAM superfamily enzyme YgiQ (UPF0313 family)
LFNDLDEDVSTIANASLPTVAALAPPDKWEVKISDEQCGPLDFDYPADFVGLTAKQGQGPRMLEVAREFKRRGIPVIFGGPHPSLAPEEVRDHCDILLVGELEAIAERFFDDLYNGRWQKEYHGERADLRLSPIPRWDLYPNHRTLSASLQTSRGCPFECEYCDVIQYAGRKQRHKEPDQVIAELEVLYKLGYRDVVLADDNLTVYRRRAKELLRALADWNAKSPERVLFSTQLSIEISDDPEMLALLAEASVNRVFIGIETANEDSLRETKKRQNVGIDLVERTDRFAKHGLLVMAGMMVGFDNDGPDIFQRQLEFAQRSSISLFQLSQLWASHATPLRSRLAAAGRLRPELDSGNTGWYTNFDPLQMSLTELREGALWLVKEIYSAENFTQRLLRMIELFPEKGGFMRMPVARPVEIETVLRVQGVMNSSPDARKILRAVRAAVQKKPAAREAAFLSLFFWVRRRLSLAKLLESNVTPPPARPPVRVKAPRALPVLG